MCGRLIKQITNRMVTLCYIKILSAFPSIFQTKYFPCFVCQIHFLLLIQHLAHCVEDIFIKKLRYFVNIWEIYVAWKTIRKAGNFYGGSACKYNFLRYLFWSETSSQVIFLRGNIKLSKKCIVMNYKKYSYS
jgi:hypothetical protein